jgi:hypothetical protein
MKEASKISGADLDSETHLASTSNSSNCLLHTLLVSVDRHKIRCSFALQEKLASTGE